VSKRFQLLAVLIAWFLTTGAQWDLVQTFGWGRMVAEYNRTMPLTEAVKKAFDGELCGVCEAVDGARQQERESAPPGVGKLDVKYVMLFQPAVEMIHGAVAAATWPVDDRFALSVARGAPPLPPPRA
jgi:hypothetical protein